MDVNPYIFRGYDIRGIVDKDLNSEIAQAIGKAYGAFLRRRNIIQAVVGRDCRATSPEYSEFIIKGLNWAGIDVIDIGMEMVGTFYWSQYYLGCRGGVYITASHNPAEYNGFKLANDFSETLTSDGIQELRRMVESDDYKQGGAPGKIEKQDIREPYFADLLKKIPMFQQSRHKINKKFKVVIDPSCATAGVVVPDLLKRAGCEVIKSNCELNPSFPLGTPDPTDIAVAQRLRKRVLEEKADIGFSYDADADRIGIVDDKGNIIWNDVLVALFSIDVLSEHPQATIMYNTLCSKAVEETIIKYGGKPFMWRTGHSFLKKKNQEVKAAFIGELSGHFFFSADFYNHDDGLYSTLRLLSYLAKTEQSLSAAISALPKYISSPEIKIYCADDKKVDLMGKIAPLLKKDFPDAEVIDDERAGDGVRIDFQDGSAGSPQDGSAGSPQDGSAGSPQGAMFVIRYSQNAPYLTIKFEAKTESRYNYLKNYISKLLHSYEEIDWNSKINLNLQALEG